MKKFILVVCLVLSLTILVGCNKKGTTDTVGDTTASGTVADANNANGDAADANVPADAAMVTLAQCLKDNGVTMYGTEWCGHCKNQKEMFGSAFTHVTYVDCDADRQACLDAGVRGFPTWADADGNLFPGTQTAERLSEIGGCSEAAAPVADEGDVEEVGADEMDDEDAAAEPTVEAEDDVVAE